MAEHFIIRRDTEAIVQGLGEDAHLFSGKTVLLSGGAGFLGKHFLRVFKRLNDTILEQPVRVISVDNFITGDPSTADRDENIAEVWADVTYPLPVREDIHYIMHAAGLASPVYYMKYPLETIESAVSGIRNLLELGRRNQSIWKVSYSSVRAKSTATPIRALCPLPRRTTVTSRASAPGLATTSPSDWQKRSRRSITRSTACR